MTTPEHRKLIAIMFTDIVSYSSLSQMNEALMLELLDEHNRLLRPLFGLHDGREVKGTGDGFLVEFASALAAVQCAVAMQTTLAEYNGSVPPERQIHIRNG